MVRMSEVHVRVTSYPTDGGSVSPSWRLAPFESRDQMSKCCQTIMGLVVVELSF